jgi:hypothetical protein
MIPLLNSNRFSQISINVNSIPKDTPSILTNFNINKFDWTCVTGRDFTWVEEQLKQLGVQNFIKEYCLGEITTEMKSILRNHKIDLINS